MGAARKTGKRAFAFLRDFVTVPTCPVCRERLPLDGDGTPFCTECLALWEKEKQVPCKVCGLPMCECVCLPPLLSENGVRDVILLTAYRSGGKTAPARLIYYVKEECDGRAFDFLARELAGVIRTRLLSEGIDASDMIVTSLPRRRASVREYGFDQARVLGMHLARELDLEYRTLLVRKFGGREQKTLNAEERRANLERAFRLKGKPDLAGKTVLLVDDVITTGSGMLAAQALLRPCGAKRVVPVTVARTVGDKTEV